MKKIAISSTQRTQFVNISEDIQKAVAEAGITDGLVTIFIPHTTAGITINENADPHVMEDVSLTLDRIVPWNAGYAHSEGNAAAHVKASLMGSSVRIPVHAGRLMLGIWQGIYFCEFDGPRRREAWFIPN